MPEIDDETMGWARQCYEADVEGFLDDPGGWHTDEAIREHYAMLARVGRCLGLDFWGVAVRVGTGFEVQRLHMIVGGDLPTIAPR